MIGFAPIAGIIADKFWFRWPLVWGFSFLLLGLLWLLYVAPTKNLWIYFPGLCAFCIALPFIMAPTLSLGMLSAPREQLGGAAGMMMSVRQLASTVGIAMMTAAYYSVGEEETRAFIATLVLAGGLAALGILLTVVLIRPKAADL